MDKTTMNTISDMMIVQAYGPDPMYDCTFSVYPPKLTKRELESAIVFERLGLYNAGKPCGPKALREHLRYLGLLELPSERTISRILTKHCLTNRRTGYYPEDYC